MIPSKNHMTSSEKEATKDDQLLDMSSARIPGTSTRQRWLQKALHLVIGASLFLPATSRSFHFPPNLQRGRNNTLLVERQDIPPSVQQTARNNTPPLALCKVPSTDQHKASSITKLVRAQVPSVNPKLCHFLSASEMAFRVSRLPPRFRLSPTSSLILANSAIHITWKLAYMDRSCKKVAFMRKHFVLSGRSLQRQRHPHTYLTSAFSHISTEHLLNNMMVLRSVGPFLEKRLTPRQYVYFYIAAVYASDFLDKFLFDGRTIDPATLKDALRDHLPDHLIQYADSSAKEQQEKRSFAWLLVPRRKGSLGASGAISALLAYFCLEFPDEKIKLGDNLEGIPARLAVLTWALIDAIGMGSHQSMVDHGAHLGGYTFGLLTYLAKEKCWLYVKRTWKKHWPTCKQWWKMTWPKMKNGISLNGFGVGIFVGGAIAGYTYALVIIPTANGGKRNEAAVPDDKDVLAS